MSKVNLKNRESRKHRGREGLEANKENRRIS